MNIDMLVGFICGVNGGIATVYVGQPLDTIKVKMQMFPHLYNDAVKCFTNTLKKDGIYRGLYAGTVPALIANVAENSILFCALAPCKQIVAAVINRPVNELNPLQNGCAGGLAAIFSALTLCPTELVKCKQQALREMFESGKSNLKMSDTGPVRICRNIYRAEGLRGFFHGLTPTFAREVPGYFCFFGVYELSSYLFMHLRGPTIRAKEDLTVFETGVCGAFAGIALWTVIFPFDVVKSRVQIASGTESASTTRKSMFGILNSILRNEGASFLYKGLGPTVVRTIPATAALFIAVEYTKKFMDFALS